MAEAKAANGEASRGAVWRTVLLLIGYEICATFVTIFSTEKLSYLYKERLSLAATASATLGVIVYSAQYARPAFGALSDFVPLFGYHRRSYLALASLLSAAAFLALALAHHYAYTMVLCLVAQAVAGVTIGAIVVDAVFVRIGNATRQVQRLQTLQISLPSVLLLLFGARLSGYVTQHWSYRDCFLATAYSALAMLPLLLLIDERRVTRVPLLDETKEAQAQRWRDQRADRESTWRALRSEIGTSGFWVIVAFVLYVWLTPTSSTALFYYEVDHLRFTKQLIGNLNAYSNAGYLGGYLLFGLFASHLPMRTIVWGIVATFALSGIPAFFLHDALSAKIIFALSGLISSPGSLGVATLGARACPPRAEAIVYAIVLAAADLGSTCSDVIGSSIYTLFSHGHHLTRGYYALNTAALIYILPAALFIPFMPAWARSRQIPEPIRPSGTFPIGKEIEDSAKLQSN